MGRRGGICDLNKFPHLRHLLRRDLALLCETPPMFCFVVCWFGDFYLTNTNLEMCFFPREQLCEVWETDIPSFISSIPSASGLNANVTQGTPLQSLSFPGNPLSLGKPDVRKGCFVKTTTRGQPLPPSHVKNPPSTSQIQDKRLFSLFEVPW